MSNKLNEHTILLIKTKPINKSNINIKIRPKHIHKDNGKLLIIGILILIIFYILLKKI